MINNLFKYYSTSFSFIFQKCVNLAFLGRWRYSSLNLGKREQKDSCTCSECAETFAFQAATKMVSASFLF